MFELNNFWLNTVIIGAAILLAFIGFSSELATKSFFNWLNNLFLRFLVVLLLGIVTLWATNAKDDLNIADTKEANKESTKSAVDLSTKSTKTIIDATDKNLKSVRLKYDSVKRELVEAIDSSSKRINESSAPPIEPELRLLSLSVKYKPVDSSRMEFSFEGKFEKIINLHLILYYAELLNTGHYSTVPFKVTLYNTINLEADAPVMQKVYIISHGLSQVVYQYFLLVGDYRDKNKTSYKFQKLLRLDPISQEYVTEFDKLPASELVHMNNAYGLHLIQGSY